MHAWARRHLRPGLFAAQILSVGTACLLLGIVALGALQSVVDRSAHSVVETESAILASAIDQSAHNIDALLDGLPVAGGVAAIDLETAVRISEEIYTQERHVERFAALAPTVSVRRLQELVESKQDLFRQYAETREPEDLERLHDVHDDVHDLASALSVGYWTEALGDYQTVESAGRWARAVLVGGVAVVLAVLSLTSWLIARRWFALIERSEDARVSLAASARTLERRNDQLRALYEVAADGLDPNDSAGAAASAVAAALRLAQANLAVLWLVTDGSMRVAATAQSSGSSVNGPTVNTASLDEALVPDPVIARRVASVGRGLLLGPGAESDFHSTGLPRFESAAVAPLFAGGQLLGAVGCWDVEASRFNDADRRLVEMLAAQVAPTLASALRLEDAERRARTDALTGIANRRQLEIDEELVFGPLLHDGTPIAVAIFDVDHFKAFNDLHGHISGDGALKVVAQLLAARSRPVDYVYRYGGEEFLLVQVDATAPQALSGVEQVLIALSGTRNLPGALTASAGVAISLDREGSFGELLSRADAALYEAKASGRNRAVLWTDVGEGRTAA